jgi:microcin C transport system substrate-binding protein
MSIASAQTLALRHRIPYPLFHAFALVLFGCLHGHAEQSYRGHALGIHEAVKYDADFEHFDYVNPRAPKGGELRLAAVGTFDSLNPFILKGVSARGSFLIYSRLSTQSLDEPLSQYGELAHTIELPADRSSVTFHLRQEGRWHDGEPITADDVVFTFETLIREGTPFYRSFYADVDRVEAISRYVVKFTLSPTDNRELPLILGQLRVLPKHYWSGRSFDRTTLEPPLGSGPYRIESVDPGHSITYRRVEGNWDEDLPVRVGQYNFDRLRYDYYRDETVAVEALKAGEYDLRSVGSAREWSTAYRKTPAMLEGRLVQQRLPHRRVKGMHGIVFNTRRHKFRDPRVREALAYAFDFEWTNATQLHGVYQRSSSYFGNSEMAAAATPDSLELRIMEEYRDRLPEEAFSTIYQPPSTDGHGLRSNLRRARRLLAAAGWQIADGVLVDSASGDAMTIEFLLSRASYERVLGPVQQNLQRLGIQSRIRTVDTSQYWNRLQQFDYDVVVRSWRQYDSPGNEQRNYWTSKAAHSPGSRNYAGIADPAVDQLVELLIAASDRDHQVAIARVLDRALQWGHYVIPLWHSVDDRLITWDKFGRPDTLPGKDLGIIRTWWVR